MKKIAKIAALTVALSSVYTVIPHKKARAFFSSTHSAIFDNALEILKNDGKSEAYTFYLIHREKISYGVISPDFKGDRNKGSGKHYYSSVDKDGEKLEPSASGYYKNRLGNFSSSARTMLEENLTMSYIEARNDLLNLSLDSIGRCVHFISDLGCSVHTTNLISLPTRNNPHHQYEKYAEKHMDNHHSKSCPDELYEAYINNDIGTMLGILSNISSSFYSDVKACTPKTFGTVLDKMLPLTENHVAAFLNAYYVTCEDKVNSALDLSKEYKIKSKQNGNVLTVASNSRVIFDKDNDLDTQKFKFVAKPDGSLRILNNHANIVSSGVFGFKCEKALSNNGFMLTKIRDSYLISTSYSEFEKYISANKRLIKSKVCEGTLNPDEDFQYFYIEETKEQEISDRDIKNDKETIKNINNNN